MKRLDEDSEAVVVNFKIGRTLLGAAKDAAWEHRMNLSEFIRAAIEEKIGSAHGSPTRKKKAKSRS